MAWHGILMHSIMNKIFLAAIIAATLMNVSCTSRNDAENRNTSHKHVYKEITVKRVNTSYHIIKPDSFKQKYTAAQQNIILTLNRVDIDNVMKLDSLVAPVDINGDIMQYSIFPFNLPAVQDVKKIIFFSYPAQAFGAYEYGNLVHWGATNMGRENAQTPTGLFFTNWKAEETKSTVDDEWILKWNFNIANKEGVGWHQYAMPGYPASHSCLRLFEADAKYLYDWADQWIQKDDVTLKAQGTPVIVFGAYPFGGTKPWLALAKDPAALDISAATLEAEVAPHMAKILAEQNKRDSVLASDAR